MHISINNIEFRASVTFSTFLDSNSAYGEVIYFSGVEFVILRCIVRSSNGTDIYADSSSFDSSGEFYPTDTLVTGGWASANTIFYDGSHSSPHRDIFFSL
jgi:hypothetical protein